MEKLYHGDSQGSSAEKPTTPTTSDKSLSSTIKLHEDSKFCLIFKGSCSKQENATFTANNRIFFFIVYELDTWPQNLDSNFTLKNFLFGGVKLAKNADPDKYSYSRYGIGFDMRIEFSLFDGSVGKNVIVFGADMSYLYMLIKKEKISSFLIKVQRKD